MNESINKTSGYTASNSGGGKTLFEKIWNTHVVKTIPGGPDVLYIDKHFIHEVTSPQAFAGIEKRGAKLFRPDKTVATADHNVPTINQHLPIRDQLSRLQVDQLIENCAKHGVELYGLGHPCTSLTLQRPGFFFSFFETYGVPYRFRDVIPLPNGKGL